MRITFVPDTDRCAGYHADELSATLVTRYHYGGGGDAALIVYIDGESLKENPNSANTLCTPDMNGVPVIAFTERAGKAGGAKGYCAEISPVL